MKRYGQLFILVLIMAALSTPVMAQGFGPCGRKQNPDCPLYNGDYGRPYGHFFNLRDRDLTEDQRTELGRVNSDFIKKTASIRSDMRQKRQEMVTYLDSQKPDERKIRDIQKQISSLRDQMDREWIEYSLSIKKIAPEARLSDAGKKGRHGRFGPNNCPVRN